MLPRSSLALLLNRIEKQLFKFSFWEFSNNELISDCLLKSLLCETLLNHIIRQLNTSKLGFYPYTSLGPTALGMYMAKSLASRYLTLPYFEVKEEEVVDRGCRSCRPLVLLCKGEKNFKKQLKTVQNQKKVYKHRSR